MPVIHVTGESLFVVVVIFGFFSWGSVVRVVRSEVRAAAAASSVEAAQNLGSRHPRIRRRHVRPTVSNSVVTALVHHVPLRLLTEAGSAFLGFESADVESSGRIVARGLVQEQARRPTFHEKPWVATVAALPLAVIVAAFKLVGDALRDAEDPRALDR
jgi:peptide/nickel transport system permease protein